MAVGFEPAADFVRRSVVPDGGKTAVQTVVLPAQKPGLVSGYHAAAALPGQFVHPPVADRIAVGQMLLQLHEYAFCSELPRIRTGQVRSSRPAIGGNQAGQRAVGSAQQGDDAGGVFVQETAVQFLGLPSDGQMRQRCRPADVSVAVAVYCQQGYRAGLVRVPHGEVNSEQGAHAGAFARLGELQCVAEVGGIGQAQGRVLQNRGLPGQSDRGGHAGAEAVPRMGTQFYEIGGQRRTVYRISVRIRNSPVSPKIGGHHLPSKSLRGGARNPSPAPSARHTTAKGRTRANSQLPVRYFATGQRRPKQPTNRGIASRQIHQAPTTVGTMEDAHT